ncbi:hypothetical protein CN172_04400 [Sinorhizobium meliloti]|uniref:hypothetical protein n=1 Tax=Rhizobium meliloti TaxID=382 RepID=UPI000FD853F5|nr:hypothetical protein [Sinorhizobium meliloti]RVG01635.1 hypothetical protein CN232_08910 [Sinorhizobium meliloti]RVH46556.1 hypothetical protein CN208_07035 [Sinorhizobium meliloti]RVK20078.1 hypothetical protein CN172_04400 [Sinorhizobium meliloti]
MTQITRRTILGGLAAAAAPLPAVSAPAPVQSAEERLKAAVSAVADILREINPAHTGMEIQQYSHYVFVGVRTPPKPVEWTGPGFYEVEWKRPNGKLCRPIFWLDRAEYKTVPGYYYRAETRWKGRLETTVKLKPEAIRIICKKDDAYAVMHA